MGHVMGSEVIEEFQRWQREFVALFGLKLGGGTYNLGFFFGPGLPRGLGRASVPWPRPRFCPGFGPGIPFLFVTSVGAGVGAAGGGAGVELGSEALSPEEVE